MNWQQICNNPAFNDLPFKFETNEWGKIEMSLASNSHSIYQGLLIGWLNKLGQKGWDFPECSVQTVKGVSVHDKKITRCCVAKYQVLRTTQYVTPQRVNHYIKPTF